MTTPTSNRFLSQTLGVLQEILATGMSTTLTIPGRLQRSRRDTNGSSPRSSTATPPRPGVPRSAT
jgi:hypothetical protein